MVWPFSRRRAAPGPENRDAVVSPEDRAVLEAVEEWWAQQDPALRTRAEGAVLQVLRPGAEDPGVVAHVRAGKLVRLEVHEAALRPGVDALVREFEKRGLWSFNGVVRTVEGPGS